MQIISRRCHNSRTAAAIFCCSNVHVYSCSCTLCSGNFTATASVQFSSRWYVLARKTYMHLNPSFRRPQCSVLFVIISSRRQLQTQAGVKQRQNQLCDDYDRINFVMTTLNLRFAAATLLADFQLKKWQKKKTKELTSPTGLREEEYSLKPRTVSSGCL